MHKMRAFDQYGAHCSTQDKSGTGVDVRCAGSCVLSASVLDLRVKSRGLERGVGYSANSDHGFSLAVLVSDPIEQCAIESSEGLDRHPCEVVRVKTLRRGPPESNVGRASARNDIAASLIGLV